MDGFRKALKTLELEIVAALGPRQPSACQVLHPECEESERRDRWPESPPHARGAARARHRVGNEPGEEQRLLART